MYEAFIGLWASNLGKGRKTSRRVTYNDRRPSGTPFVEISYPVSFSNSYWTKSKKKCIV